MTDRILPPDEWPKLDGTLLECVWRDLDPRKSYVVVVESESGEILGCCALTTEWRLDGAWVAPEHRKKAAVGRHLLSGVNSILQMLGVREVVTMAFNDEGKSLAQRIGPVTHLDCAHYSVKVVH